MAGSYLALDLDGDGDEDDDFVEFIILLCLPYHVLSSPMKKPVKVKREVKREKCKTCNTSSANYGVRNILLV